MKQVGIFEAKTHLSALVDDAERGRATLITRNGKPVARIMPVDEPQPRQFGCDDGLGRIADDFNGPLTSGFGSAFER
jgi:prevent-host-death family protein